VRRIISKDHSMGITKDDNVQEKFNKLMGEFLKEIPARIDSIPCTIILDVENGDDWWNFVAHIESVQLLRAPDTSEQGGYCTHCGDLLSEHFINERGEGACQPSP